MLFLASGVVAGPVKFQKREDANIPDACVSDCSSYISTFTYCGELGVIAEVNACQCTTSTAETVVSCLSCMSGTGNATNTAYVTKILEAYNDECVDYTNNNGSWTNTTATSAGGMNIASTTTSSASASTTSSTSGATMIQAAGGIGAVVAGGLALLL
ncbi:hypothetical protein MNV49_002640 [Pseudohyphozyma bogoriensis]|nr:hypothetical protein MNV49_002640 [Pseudohyphozyma bogoriensis]